MRLTLSSSLLLRLSELVAEQTGLNFPQERWGDLERDIAAAAPDFNFSDLESCVRWLLSAPLTRNTKEILATHLTVGETYFFREKQNLEILEKQILPPLLQARRQNQQQRLRIWSAGCCTGEEAYTLAILLDRLIPDLKEWNITILATDINPKFLRKAAQGIYSDWSFRDTPDWLRERYFTTGKDGRYEILPRIKKMVTFSYLNFADDVYPSLSNNTGAMDVIFCRNVLMYFSAQRAKQVVGNFHRALVDGGWIIVSPTEASNRLLSAFARVEFPETVLYRKILNAEFQIPKPRPDISEHPFSQSFRETETAPASQSVVQIEPVHAPQVDSTPSSQTQESEIETPLIMARNCANQGQLSEAMEWCEKAIIADKMNPSHHYLLATILQEQGQHDIAIQSLMRTLYLDPDFVLVHFSLGNLHQSQGRYREAQRYFGNALLLLRNHPSDETLTEADGLTAGRLAEIITSLQASLPQSATSNV